MNGGYRHEQAILGAMERILLQHKFETTRQVSVDLGKERGFVDLVAERGPLRLVVEAELSARRIQKDLRKAAAMDATWLWIVVPNGMVQRSVRSRLRKLRVRERHPWLAIFTLSQAVNQVNGCFPVSLSEGKTENRTLSPGNPAPQPGNSDAQNPPRQEEP